MRRADGSPRPLVLGHRGYRARFPENTLLSFREAMAAGADGIECDVQKTADGRYVVIHDADTLRVTGGQGGPVSAMSLEQVRTLDAGSGERVPLLEEVLDAQPPGAFIDVELKEETLRPGDCAAIAAILGPRVSRDRLMISSFEPGLLRPMKKLGFTVAFLVGENAQSRGMGWLIASLVRLRPHWINLAVQAFAILGPRRARRLCAILRALGARLLFWTVNDAAETRGILGLADAIVTDEVELVLAVRSGSAR